MELRLGQGEVRDAMNRIYSISSYDRHNLLRVSFGLLAVMLYSIRHLLMVLAVYNPNPKFAALAYMKEMATPVYMATDLPALMVLFAWLYRRPDVKMWAKIIWRNGRALLMLSAAWHFLVLAYSKGPSAIEAFLIRGDGLLVLGNLLLDLLVLSYLFLSLRVRDTFADFPKMSS